jgi:hypothetical protein
LFYPRPSSELPNLRPDISKINVIGRDLLIPDNHQQLHPSNSYIRGVNDDISILLGKIFLKITWFNKVYKVNFSVVEKEKEIFIGTLRFFLHTEIFVPPR